MKALLLLDVDGVLNPFALRPGALPPGFQEYSLLGYKVRLTQRHGEWLAKLADRYDLVWATTWEEDANRLIAPRVGLPDDLPVISFGDLEPAEDWKLPAIIEHVGGRAFAWIDDDIGRKAEAWAATRPAPTLLLRADPGIGLARRHIDALERFAVRLAAEGP